MIFSANQIVGLIEIETPSGTGSECLVALGLEEQSLGDLLAWLTGTIAEPLAADDAAEAVPPAGPIHRLAALVAAEPVPMLAANLDQLKTDLADAAAQFRLRLSASSAAE